MRRILSRGSRGGRKESEAVQPVEGVAILQYICNDGYSPNAKTQWKSQHFRFGYFYKAQLQEGIKIPDDILETHSKECPGEKGHYPSFRIVKI